MWQESKKIGKELLEAIEKLIEEKKEKTPTKEIDIKDILVNIRDTLHEIKDLLKKKTETVYI